MDEEQMSGRCRKRRKNSMREIATVAGGGDDNGGDNNGDDNDDDGDDVKEW